MAVRMLLLLVATSLLLAVDAVALPQVAPAAKALVSTSNVAANPAMSLREVGEAKGRLYRDSGSNAIAGLPMQASQTLQIIRRPRLPSLVFPHPVHRLFQGLRCPRSPFNKLWDSRAKPLLSDALARHQRPMLR